MMILFKPQLISILIILFFSSCKNNKTEELKVESTNKDSNPFEIKTCISCFNILLKDSFDENTIFNEISYSTPSNIDTVFYNEIENYYSFFVKLENEDLLVYLYVDTFDIKQRGIKFYQLNSINEKLYINQNESFVCFQSFLDKCECDSSDSSLIEQLKPVSAINTYDTNLFGTWASDDEEIEISFEEDYFIYDYDTIYFEKLGSYLLDKSNKDTLATIQAISMNNLILNCELINDGEMIYYKKTILHPLSKK